MTPFPSAARAEMAVLEGRNESQDSQAILDAMKAEFGVGTVRTSRSEFEPRFLTILYRS